MKSFQSSELILCFLIEVIMFMFVDNFPALAFL